MADESKCPVCGAPLPCDAPEGFCPACSFHGALRVGDTGRRQKSEVGGQRSADQGQGPKGLEEATDAQSENLFRGPFLGKGQVFGDYELLEEIGCGGMGVVYKARQRSLDRVVALKFLLFGPHATAGAIRRLRSEAVAAAAMQHPNIVAVHEVGFHEDQHFIVMDYVAGESLSEKIRGQPLPARVAARYVRLIAEAVHFAHERGILHRDLKPSNVLIDVLDQPRVADFGLAKRLDDSRTPALSPQLTLTGQVLGSPSYMPPEQAAGKPGALSRSADVYALGAILYHALTGRPPFVGEGLAETMQQLLHEEPLALRSLNASVPADLETVSLRCLEKEPGKRYETAQLLAEELGRFLADQPILARPVGRLEKGWRWCRRNPRVALAAGTALLSLLAGLAGVTWGWRRADVEWRKTRASEWSARQNAYAADMKEAQRRLEADNVLGAWELLSRHQPEARSEVRSANSEEDLRDWEWRYLWKLCQPDPSIELKTKFAPTESAFFSQDGRVVAGKMGTDRIEVWDLTTQRQKLELTGLGSSTVLGLSSDGRLLAAGQKQAQVLEIWDLTSSQLKAKLQSVLPRCVAFSPDGQLLATFERHKTNAVIRIIEWATQLTLARFTADPTRRSEAGVVAFSPAGDRLAIGEDYQEGKAGRIRIVRWPSRSEISIPTHNTNGVVALAFSPDSRLLAAGFAYSDGNVRLWDAETGQGRGVLTNDLGWVESIAFSPNGGLLAAGTGPRIHIWRMADGLELREIRAVHRTLCLQFLPGERTPVSASGDGSVRFWDVQSGSRVEDPVPIRLTTNWAAAMRFGVAFAPDSRSFITPGPSGALAAWDTATMQRAESLSAQGTNNWGVIRSPDGRWLATGDRAGQVHIWDWETQRLVKSLDCPFGWCGFLRFSRSNRFLWAWIWSHDDTVTARIWKTGAWQEVPLSPAQLADIMSLALSPDDRLLATGSSDGWLKLWTFPEGQCVAEFTPCPDWVFCVQFSPDGRVLASTGSDGKVTLWDVAARRKLAELPGYLGKSFGLAFSPKGRRLAVGGGDVGGNRSRDAVTIWDLATYRELLTVSAEGQFFTDLTFSPNGDTLAATCISGIAQLWRVPKWEEIEAAENRTRAP